MGIQKRGLTPSFFYGVRTQLFHLKTKRAREISENLKMLTKLSLNLSQMECNVLYYLHMNSQKYNIIVEGAEL